MKRQKRDLTTRAYARGYRVGLSGKSRELCPADEGDARQNWMGGWRQGRADFWDGYTGVAALHCAPSVP